MAQPLSLSAMFKALNIDQQEDSNSAIALLTNITSVLETIHKESLCFTSDILKQVKCGVKFEAINNRLLRTADIRNLLTTGQVPVMFTSIVTKLLQFTVIKLYQGSNEDAPSILKDFKQLQNCIFAYKKYSTWDCGKLDEIVVAFQKKLIQMLKNLNRENCSQKMLLFANTRTMIVHIGKHDNYSTETVRILTEEIRKYSELLKSTKVGGDTFIYETNLGYLFILNHLIEKCLKTQEDRGILADLRSVLNDIVALDKIKHHEDFIVRNILSIVNALLN